MTAILCWTCKHRRPNPGDCHIRCGARTEGDALLKTFLEEGAASAIRWLSFDPNFPQPVTQCELYAPAETRSEP